LVSSIPSAYGCCPPDIVKHSGSVEFIDLWIGWQGFSIIRLRFFISIPGEIIRAVVICEEVTREMGENLWRAFMDKNALTTHFTRWTSIIIDYHWL
jgi:hypothetical protein